MLETAVAEIREEDMLGRNVGGVCARALLSSAACAFTAHAAKMIRARASHPEPDARDGALAPAEVPTDAEGASDF